MIDEQTRLLGLAYSNLRFLGKNLLLNTRNFVTAPGARRKTYSHWNYYSADYRSMVHYYMYFGEEHRVTETIVRGLNSFAVDPLPNNNTFMTSVDGLLYIDKPGDVEFYVSGDDGIMFSINGRRIERHWSAGVATGTVHFDKKGWYDFRIVTLEYYGAQGYAIKIKNDAGEWEDIPEEYVRHRSEGCLAGLHGRRVSVPNTSGVIERDSEAWDDMMAYMEDHVQAHVIANEIWYDNASYYFRDRGNYWGYIFDGYIKFPEAGEWEIGQYSDNAMLTIIDGKKIFETRPPSWDRIVRPSSVTVNAGKGTLHKIRVVMYEITGGEIFLWGIRKKGDTNWITDLTGLVCHDAVEYNGRLI